MTRRPAIIPAVVAATIFAFAAGCFNVTRDYQEKFYYQLEYNPPAVSGPAFDTVVVRVGSFQVAPSYQSQKILYSTSKRKRKPYEYHLWIVNPGDMIADLLVRDMIEAKQYRAVVDVRSSINPDYEIEGIIDEIYEKDDNDTWFSVLQMRVILMSHQGGKKSVLFQRNYRESHQAETHTPESVVTAMSAATKILSSKIQADVSAAVADHEAKKASEVAATP
ncbi:MAG: membrane integrity-associated transporter subunit PqiC [Deltaproteobacteria bacterium]|nr:membrane integrity-associated transporter subunit PqiC [Deltaproteobacteria bacterium]